MSAESDSPILVYVGTYNEDPAEGIHHLLLDPASGSLGPAGTTPGVPTPFFIRVDAAGRRLYAANALDECDGVDQGAVSAFDLDPATGALTFLGRQPSGGTLPCYIDLTRDGRFLLAGNYNSGSVGVLPVEAGGLGPPAATAQHEGSSIDEERQEGPHVHCMVLDPTGRWALAADLGTDEVRVYGLTEGEGCIRRIPRRLPSNRAPARGTSPSTRACPWPTCSTSSTAPSPSVTSTRTGDA